MDTMVSTASPHKLPAHFFGDEMINILEEFSVIYKSIGNNIKSTQYSKASLSVQNYKKKRIYKNTITFHI